MNRLVIVGAGGHGKVVADIAIKSGYKDICFLDDNIKGSCMDFPIIGECSILENLNNGNTDFVLAIGNNKVRKAIAEKYNINWIKLIHPSTQIAVNVKIGKGTVVMANAVINACTTIGEHCIINTGAIVEHDNKIGDFVHISPKAALGGTVCIGAKTHIGIGATVINNISICEDCIIGAGAVVVKNIENFGTYIGVPARRNS